MNFNPKLRAALAGAANSIQVRGIASISIPWRKLANRKTLMLVFLGYPAMFLPFAVFIHLEAQYGEWYWFFVYWREFLSIWGGMVLLAFAIPLAIVGVPVGLWSLGNDWSHSRNAWLRGASVAAFVGCAAWVCGLISLPWWMIE